MVRELPRLADVYEEIYSRLRAAAGGGLGGRVLLQQLEGYDLERALVRGGQHHRRADRAFEQFEPAGGAYAPAVARLKAGKLEFGPWRGKVVADEAAVLEELSGDFNAHGVTTVVLGAGVAPAVAKETGHRIG